MLLLLNFNHSSASVTFKCHSLFHGLYHVTELSFVVFLSTFSLQLGIIFSITPNIFISTGMMNSIYRYTDDIHIVKHFIFPASPVF